MGSTKAHAIDVRDLRVLVTAGAGGIGRVIAEAFAAAGACVHVTDVSEKALADVMAAGSGITGTVGDAASTENADAVARDVATQLGGLDMLINNVGIAGPTGGVEALSDADIDRTLDVNLKSHFHYLKRCVPLLKKSSRNPSVLAMSSVAGRLGYGYRTPYAATKWGIVGLVKSLAVELGPDGIRANAILPGVVNGPRMDGVIADRAQALGISFEEMRQSYLNKISLRRMVDAEDVAHLALFLASDLARNITGQAISVDGNVEYL
ncbi:SDR family oxidoreductase [Dongia sp.]|uniref:SDR family oxidoreductase n=1 Tax=Dongia sp. TaxID=1977262 RepID=UPI0035B3565B